MMAPNGTRFGGWLLNTADNTFGPAGDFDGDGHAEILVASPWGIGILKLAGAHADRADDGAERHALRRLAAQHRRQQLRPGRRLRRRRPAPRSWSTSPWGIGILKLAGATMSRADDGSPTARASAAGCSTPPTTSSAPPATTTATAAPRLLVTSPWGIGILKQAGARWRRR